MKGRSAWPALTSVRPRSAKDRGTISSRIAPSQSRAVCQPKASMKPWLIGAKANWPKEEAAVAMPKIIGRFSSGTARPKAAMTTLNEQMAMPTPVMTPAVRMSRLAVGEKAVSRTPAA